MSIPICFPLWLGAMVQAGKKPPSAAPKQAPKEFQTMLEGIITTRNKTPLPAESVLQLHERWSSITAIISHRSNMTVAMLAFATQDARLLLEEIAKGNPNASFGIRSGFSFHDAWITVRSGDNQFAAALKIDLTDEKTPVKASAKTGLRHPEVPNVENQLLWMAEKMCEYKPEK